jgi:diguanylate cyclase (GGDEF)-like protein
MKPAKDDPAGPAVSNDRTTQALMSVLDDLSVQREESGLLRSTLEHVVLALEATGGLTLLGSEEDRLEPAAQHRLETAPSTLSALASQALGNSRPLVREQPSGGWMAATVLASQQRRLGALALYDQRAGTVPPSLELLEALGRQIGTGLENVRLYGELRASAARLESLHRITAAVTADMDLGRAVHALAQEIAAAQTFDRLACGFVNDAGDYLEIIGHPEGTSWGFGAVLPVVGSGVGSVLLNNSPLVQSDLLSEHRYIEDMKLLEEGIRSYMLLPLSARGRVIGVLALGSRRPEAFEPQALDRLQPLAHAAALALENVRLLHKTRELSLTDEVTPLFNFRFFHQILDRELKFVDRYKSTLSLIFLDLDRFKPINDQHGHLRGSRVLREVGFLLRAAVRETDFPARYGGDEFCVILPQTDTAAARSLAEKLRRIIEGHTFLQEEGINARLGASVGIASYPLEAGSKEALIRLADERMYADKEVRGAGR